MRVEQVIILSPGALDKVFSTESSPSKVTAQAPDSRFRDWLKSADATAPANPSGATSSYRSRTTRFE